MEITHRTKNLRIAPRKLRLVVDKLRHKDARYALAMSQLLPQKGGGLLYKSLKSAIEVAKDSNLDPTTLVIQRAWCDEGSSMKRSVSHSRGRMAPIMKKHSHLSLVLAGQPMGKTKKAPAKSTALKEETPTTANEEEK